MASDLNILLASAAACGLCFSQPGGLSADPGSNTAVTEQRASDAVEWQRLRTISRIAYQNKRLDEAERYLQDAIRLAERMGLNDDRLASVLADLGTLRLEQGRTSDAERLFGRAAELYRSCGNGCATATATTLKMLSTAFRLQGRLSSAEQAAREGLARIRMLTGASSERANLRDELGWIHLYRDQPHLAADTFRRGIDELRDARGSGEQLAQLYHSLATASFQIGDFEEAERACYRALELFDATKAPHLAAATYLRLGQLSAELGRHEDAERQLNRAHELYLTTPGTSPFELWPVHHEMANLDMRRGNYGRAREKYLEALRLAEPVMEGGHPEMMKLRTNYAALLRKQGRKKDAERIESDLRALWNRRDVKETDSYTTDARDARDRHARSMRKSP